MDDDSINVSFIEANPRKQMLSGTSTPSILSTSGQLNVSSTSKDIASIMQQTHQQHGETKSQRPASSSLNNGADPFANMTKMSGGGADPHKRHSVSWATATTHDPAFGQMQPFQSTEDFCEEHFGFRGAIAPFSHHSLINDKKDDFSFRGLQRCKLRNRKQAKLEVTVRASSAMDTTTNDLRPPSATSTEESRRASVTSNSMELPSLSESRRRSGFGGPGGRRSSSVGPHALSSSHHNVSTASKFDVSPENQQYGLPIAVKFMESVQSRNSVTDPGIATALNKRPSLKQIPSFLRRQSTAINASLDMNSYARKASVGRGNALNPIDQRTVPFYNMNHTEAVDGLNSTLDGVATSIESRVIAQMESDRRIGTKKADAITLCIEHPQPHLTAFVRKEAAAGQRKHIRQFYCEMWKFVMGRVVLDCRVRREFVMKEAKKEVLALRKRRDQEVQAEVNKKRCHCAVELFSDIMRRLRQGKVRHAVLTEEKYFALKEQFQIICNNDTLLLNLKELRALLDKSQLQVDPAIFKKMDRDRGGYVDIEELLHIMYPALPIKDIKLLRKKWEGPADQKDAATLRQDLRDMLSEESIATINRAFKQLDVKNKGVLVRSDFNVAIPSADWQEKLNIDSYFPTPTSIMTLEEFTDVMRIGFPPFNTGSANFTRNNEPVQTNPFPKELLELQDKMTSAM